MKAKGDHHLHDASSVRCAIVTISDTRSMPTDLSGAAIKALLEEGGHRVSAHEIVPDEAGRIREKLLAIAEGGLADVIVATGGTGITSRDRTYEVAQELVEVELPGFGEIFRMLSFQEVGAVAILSRAMAGILKQRVALFVLPGSEAAVRLAVSRLIAPALGHLVGLLRK